MYSTNDILTALKDRYEDKDISINEYVKNNGCALDGVTIKNRDEALAPVIYLNRDFSTEEAVKRVIDIYENSSAPSVDANMFSDFERLRNSLTFILVNRQANIDILDQYVGRPFLDLYAIATLNLSEISGSVKVTKNLVRSWNMSEEELLSIAAENFYSHKTIIDNISSILPEVLNIDILDMWILKGDDDCYGAARMMDTDALQQFAETNDTDLYVIPSSIHECIILPADDRIEREFVNEMIESVNETEVQPQEILSNHVYFYSRIEKWQF